MLTWLASKIAGVHLPPSNIGLLDLDMWFDYFLRAEPAIIMVVAMLFAVTMIYLLIFQITLARTVGMRVMGIKIIDWYGDAPIACAVRRAHVGLFCQRCNILLRLPVDGL